MSFCPSCGAKNPETARFCDQCGTELILVSGSSSPASAAQPTVIASPIVATGQQTCPQCKTAIIPGEAFCENCGASLLAISPTIISSEPEITVVPVEEIPPQPIYPLPQPVGQPATPVPAQPIPVPPPSIPNPIPAAQTVLVVPTVPTGAPLPAQRTLAPAQLIIRDSGVSLPLPQKTQAIVGRIDQVSNFFPDIDLTPYGAIQGGVGRRHISLNVQGNQLFVEDLDSTNGTFVNGQRLIPHTPSLLNDNDELFLGRLALKVRM